MGPIIFKIPVLKHCLKINHGVVFLLKQTYDIKGIIKPSDLSPYKINALYMKN